MAYSWDELYPNLKFLFIGCQYASDGITVQEMMSLDQNLTYQSAYHRFKRMVTNGLFYIERNPRPTSGGHPAVRFVITKAGIKRVSSLKNRGIYQESYDEEYWRLW